MRSPNLKSMSASDLIDLRAEVDAILSKKVAIERKALEASLRKLEGHPSAEKRGRLAKVRTSTLAGKKIAPKYRGPDGQTWTGRGLKPRWMAEALEGGKQVEDFLIEATKGRKRGKA